MLFTLLNISRKDESDTRHSSAEQEGNRKRNVSYQHSCPVLHHKLIATCSSSPEASWHTDYRDTAYVYFGGLPYEVTEGDVITIFSQFGEPVFLKLVRDKETGKSKGFGWLKYENQKSTDLAVDNLGGAEISGRMLRVDHARYQARDDEDPEEFKISWEDMMRREGQALSEDESSEEEKQRPMLPEERELALLMQNHDDDDPMKGFLIEEKKKEIEEARQKADRKEKKHKHRHHRSHRSKRDTSEDGRRTRSRRDDDLGEKEERHHDRESRRHRDDRPRERDGRRYRESRRDKRDEDDTRERSRDRDRKRHDEDEGEPRHRRRRDDHREDRKKRQSRSRSPRRHRD